VKDCMGNAKEKAGPRGDRGLDEEKLSEKERAARKSWWACRKRTREPKEILKSISASPGKIRYRESWNLRERARVSK